MHKIKGTRLTRTDEVHGRPDPAAPTPDRVSTTTQKPSRVSLVDGGGGFRLPFAVH
jgi:hypothetical protein